MELFSAEERASIEAAITKAESKTSGEIIVVVATASAGYFAYALMWAALLALLVPWPLIYFTNWPVEHIYLAQLGVSVPGGFATTAEAFRRFVAHNDLGNRIFAKLETLDVEDVDALVKAGAEIRGWVMDAPLQPELDTAIREAYAKLCAEAGGEVSVAVRSSATAEDLPDASFAGQQETYLNVTGEQPLLETCKRCFASLFTDRAISYREDKGFDHFDIALSIGVQQMVRSDLASSGVMFSMVVRRPSTSMSAIPLHQHRTYSRPSGRTSRTRPRSSRSDSTTSVPPGVSPTRMSRAGAVTCSVAVP